MKATFESPETVISDKTVIEGFIQELFKSIEETSGLRAIRSTGDKKMSCYFEIEGFLDCFLINPRFTKKTKEVMGYTLTLPWRPGGSCFSKSYPTRPDGTFKYGVIAAEIARRYRNAKLFISREGSEVVEPASIAIANVLTSCGQPPSFIKLSASDDPDKIVVEIPRIELDSTQVTTLILACKSL